MKRTILLLLAISFTGCAGFREAWKPENKAATVAALKADALRILGSAAVNLIGSYVTNDNATFAHSAARAAWSAVSLGDIQRLVQTAGGSKALAVTVEDEARKAVANGVREKDAVFAAAAAISVAAFRHD